jgi:hypothetical protein
MVVLQRDILIITIVISASKKQTVHFLFINVVLKITTFTISLNNVVGPILLFFCNLVQHSCAGRDETKVWSTWVQDSTEVLRMELHSDKILFVFDFDDFHSHTFVIFADKR